MQPDESFSKNKRQIRRKLFCEWGRVYLKNQVKGTNSKDECWTKRCKNIKPKKWKLWKWVVKRVVVISSNVDFWWEGKWVFFFASWFSCQNKITVKSIYCETKDKGLQISQIMIFERGNVEKGSCFERKTHHFQSDGSVTFNLRNNRITMRWK